MTYRELMRQKLLEQIYDKMSDEEKRLFVQLTLQNRDHREIMAALGRQKADLEAIKKKQNWVTDFGSDVAANFLTDGLILIGRKLLKRF